MLGIVIQVTDADVTCRGSDGESVVVPHDNCDPLPKEGDVVELAPFQESGLDGATATKWLVLPTSVRLRPLPCSKIRPQPDRIIFEGRDGPRRVTLTCTFDLLGVEADEGRRLQRYEGGDDQFVLIINGGGDPVDLVWPKPVAEVRTDLAARAEASDEAKRQQDLRKVRERAQRQDVFVNPYTYVPFPPNGAKRREPAGHAHLAPGQLCGWFDVEFSLLTPLLIRYPAPDGARQRWVFPRRGGQPFIPGSSLKGAVRSLHETLTGSCLRVVDLNHVPVYRDKVAQRPDTWMLARVDKVGYEGRIEEVQVCDQVAWVPVELLHETLGGWENVRTGATIDVKRARGGNEPRAREGARRAGGDRRKAVEISRGEGWVILVTDSGARRSAKPRKDKQRQGTREKREDEQGEEKQPYYFAAGRLTKNRLTVPDKTWRRYLEAVKGADDVRRARQEGEPGIRPQPEIVTHRHDGQRLGRRHSAALGFNVGDVVWVRQGAGGVEEIALSYVWRSEGSGPVNERLPPGFEPCSDPAALCPSCRLFGMADTSGDEPGSWALDRPGEPEAYGGHVRFGDAVAVGEIEPRSEQLAPLGQPRLGSGQFSLQTENTTAPGTPPTRQWGSDADNPQPRLLRGRRMYWQGDPAEQEHPRHRPRKRQTEGKMVSEVELIDPPATFRARIHFSGVTEAQLGGLLAAVAPSLLLPRHRPPGFRPDGQIAGRLGGGKPFGFGTVQAQVVGLRVEDVQSRYGSATAPPLREREAVDTFAADPDGELAPDVVTEVWPALAAVLHTGQVNPERIWYPPGDTWEAVGTDAFDRPYAFFRRSAGDEAVDKQRPMVTLPDPRGPNQSLDIERGK